MNESLIRPELTSRLERLVGARVESCRRVEGGYTPTLRLLCGTSKGSFFAKVGTTPSMLKAVRREIHVYNSLRGDFMPRLIASEDDESEPVLVIEDLSSRHWPPPWDARQVELTLAQVDALHNTRAPLETYAEIHAGYGPN